MIDRHPYPPDVKLAQLIQMCKGKAKDAIKHLVVITPTAEGYGMARKTLEFRFGNQTLLKANDAEALYDLAVKMRNCYVILSHWKKEHMLDAQSYLRDIFDRLPYHVQMDYLRDESWKNGPIPSYMHLLEYVEKRAHLSNTFYGRLMAERYVKSRQQVNPRPRSAKTYTTTSSTIATTRGKKSDNKFTKNTQIQCLCCGDSHFLYHCTKFKDKDTKQRRDFVREYKACFNCLRAGHNVKDRKLTTVERNTTHFFMVTPCLLRNLLILMQNPVAQMGPV
ncbi:uncharacterized protein LOC144411794 [Styela clava]